MRSSTSPDQFGCTRTTSSRRAIGPSTASTTSATPSQANIAAQCSRTASSSASKARPAPKAVSTCTENAAARAPAGADGESCWLIRFIWPAGLSGILLVCTSAVAAISRVNSWNHGDRCGLENAAGNVNCPDMNDASAIFDIAVVGGGPAGLGTAIALAESGAKTALIARRAPYADNRTTALLGGSVDFLQTLDVWPRCKDNA